MSLTIPNTQKTVILARFANNQGFTAEQAVKAANERGIILAPNTELNRRLVLTDTWKGEKEVYPAWSGTLVINVQADVSFSQATKGGYLLYKDSETGITYRLKVPTDYLPAINSILVIEHGFDAQGKPTFEIHEDGSKKRIIHIPDENKLELIQNYPTANGWYLTDERFGIPTGNSIDSSDPNACYLWRSDSIISLAARVWDYDGGYRRYVDLDCGPSGRLGVLGFAPDLQKLATEAEGALAKLAGVANETLEPIRKLIEAAKQNQ